MVYTSDVKGNLILWSILLQKSNKYYMPIHMLAYIGTGYYVIVL